VRAEMRQYSGLCLCLGMLVGCGSGTHPIDLSRSREWPVVEFAEAFDRAAHLEPLSNGTEPELRVWVARSMGFTTGKAISTTGARACTAEYRNDGRTASVERAHCAASDMPLEKRRSALDLLPALSALSGKSWGCALGGETFFVEGFVNRQRFAFLVSNPGSCKDSDSLLVKRLVEVLSYPSAS
jgi:hypothetical protein